MSFAKSYQIYSFSGNATHNVNNRVRGAELSTRALSRQLLGQYSRSTCTSCDNKGVITYVTGALSYSLEYRKNETGSLKIVQYFKAK